MKEGSCHALVDVHRANFGCVIAAIGPEKQNYRFMDLDVSEVLVK
jgi:hypothetical protein